MNSFTENLQVAVDREELLALTSDLISIASYPGIENQEAKVAEYICARFCKEGIESWTEEVCDGRKNVYARLKGTGGGKTLMFNGHIDTVPPYDMPNATQPQVKDGRLYGRGASDMKGPVATMIASMVALKRLGIGLSGDVLFAGVIDEEQRSYGTIRLVESGLRADAAIIGEPTELRVCTGHRGLEWYEFRFIGKTVHGGKQDEGVNAISKAAKFIRCIEEEYALKLKKIYHPLLGHPTVNIGVITGGTQLSTVAGECTVLLDRRFLPCEKYADVERGLKQVLEKLATDDPSFKCVMKVTDDSLMKPGYVHLPLETDATQPIVELVQKRLAEMGDYNTEPMLFPAWTDAGIVYGYAGIPSVVIGPGHIECCHSQNEYIELNQLQQGYLLYAQCAHDFCR